MNTDWQTWAALAVVTLAVVYLVRSSLRKRNSHEGCDCPGASGNREFAKLKKKMR